MTYCGAWGKTTEREGSTRQGVWVERAPWPSAWPFLQKHKQTGVFDAALWHSSLVKSHCRYFVSSFWRPTREDILMSLEKLLQAGWMVPFFATTVTLSGGLASTGAPRTPPARLFFRFSWTWVSCSSRSTLSASLIRHASSSSETRLLREDFLLPATAAQKIKRSKHTSKYKTDRGYLKVHVVHFTAFCLCTETDSLMLILD